MVGDEENDTGFEESGTLVKVSAQVSQVDKCRACTALKIELKKSKPSMI